MSKKIWIILVVFILLGAGGAYWYFLYPSGNGPANEEEKKAKDYPHTNPELKMRYADDELDFFVDYPEGFVVSLTEEEAVKLILFSKSDSKESFQIFITPFDEPGPITPERILIDEPKMVIKAPVTVTIAGEEALVFFSSDAEIGDVREVWFVHGEHLYQASTYDEYDELLSKVMATFKFK